MPQTTTTNPPRLGRCKECDFALFVADTSSAIEAESFRDVKGDGHAYRVGNEGFFGRCPQRHKFFPLKPVKGTYSPDHECDARCLNAKGHECTCSCGGANHGRGYATTHIATPGQEDRSIAQAARETVASTEGITERQEKFLRMLLDERELPDIGRQDQGTLVVTGEDRKSEAHRKLDAKEITKRQASKTIEWLLTLPMKEES